MIPGEVARTFDELATCLDVLAARPGRARAYRELARRISTAGKSAKRWLDPGAPLPFRTPSWLSRELTELVRDGSFAARDQVLTTVPSDILKLVDPLGVTVARSIWQKTKAHTLAELADLARSGFLPTIPGLGPAKRARLTALLPPPRSGMLLVTAVEASFLVEDVLRDAGARNVAAVGETRRGEELVGQLEMLVAGLSPREVAAAIRSADAQLLVRTVAVEGDDVQCILQGRGPVVVRVVDIDAWHLHMIRATGDADHVAWLETRALSRGGLANVARGATSEADVYQRLGLHPIAPELRHGVTGPEPENLLPRNSIRGAFHAHTDWSDGSATIEAMAREAARAGYEYLGISDHSSGAPYANGLDGDRLASQRKDVQRARRSVPQVEIFQGLEVDILPDGSLDLDDGVLADLDFVIASVHTATDMTPERMTNRLLRALKNPLVTVLGHPTGRLLSGKGGYAFDLDAVARAARANDTWIEINANGHRLDVSAALARRAHAHGVLFAIDPDAHTPNGLFDVALGERIARRAGLPADAIVNTRGRRAMIELLKTRRKHARMLLGFT